jgi:hypothetical protein
MLFAARTPEHSIRPRAPVLARVLGCGVLALFAGCLTSAAALASTLPEGTGLPAVGAVSEVAHTPLTGGGGSGVPPVVEAVGVGKPSPGTTPVQAPPQSEATTPGAAGGTSPGGSGPAGAPEEAAPAPGPIGLPRAVEGTVGTGSPVPPAVGASPEGSPNLPTGSGGSTASETPLAPRPGSGVLQQPPAKGSGSTSDPASDRSAEGGSGAATADSPPPPSGGSPTAASVPRPSSESSAPPGVPVQIVADTISASPFTPERLALGPALAGGQPPGPGGTLARLVVAKVPAAGSLTLSCLTRSQTVRCALLAARQDPGRLRLAYAGAPNIPPKEQALAPSAGSDRIAPPPAGDAGLPGSSELLGGSSSAASAASGATAAAMLLFAATLLLASPLILRRLLDVCERWLASPLDLVLERPD